MLRVLVVDGYEESRNASVHELRRHGHEVVAVEEEDEALLVLEDKPFDVVVLDLPPSEAEEAASAIRSVAKRSPTSTTTIIAVVEPSTSRLQRDAGRASGIDYFILRPCPPVEIAKHLRRLHGG